MAQVAESKDSIKYGFKEATNSDLPGGKMAVRYRVRHLGLNAFAGFDFSNVSLVFHHCNDLNKFYQEADRKYKAKSWGIRFRIAIGNRKPKQAGQKPNAGSGVQK